MRRLHFIGICGAGMSATAMLAKEAGDVVTGSDAECYGPPARTLAIAGIEPRIGYSADALPKDVDAYVIGRNAKLTKENPEVAQAYTSGKPILSFPEVIASYSKERDTLVVCGSYGKSTTTAIVAHILSTIDSGGYLIGAEPLSLPSPARVGKGLFVIEGDEYPSSHEDQRAKFLHYKARDVILTSVVHDHVNVYPTFESYQKPFIDLLGSLPADGLVVVSADEPHARILAESSGKHVVTYGRTNGTYKGENVQLGMPSTFTLTKNGESIAELSTPLLGMHNIENIVGACAYLLERKLVTTDQLVPAVASFTGIRRRLDNIAPASRVMVFEGFGSSYEKAVSAIQAVHSHFKEKKLVVVFEPHTFGWRNRANLSWYDTVFAGASRVFVAPPETQGAQTHDQLTYEDIVSRIQATGMVVEKYDPEHPEQAVSTLDEGSVVLVLTSGDLEGSLPTFAKAVTEKFPH